MSKMSELYNSLKKRDQMAFAKRMRDRLNQYVEETLKGSVATAKFYSRDGYYAEGFVASYCTDRRIARIRVYASGDCYAYDSENGALHRHSCPDWNELA